MKMRPKEQFLTILFLFWSYAKTRSNWKLGLEIEKNAIKVDNSLDYNIPGIFAMGT
jgi:thioredoxin reductase